MGSLLLPPVPRASALPCRIPGSWFTSLRAAPRARPPTSRSRPREILTLRKRLNEIYVRHTGQPIEAIERKLERDAYMSAEESRDFGIVDEVVENRPVPEELGGRT